MDEKAELKEFQDAVSMFLNSRDYIKKHKFQIIKRTQNICNYKDTLKLTILYDEKYYIADILRGQIDDLKEIIKDCFFKKRLDTYADIDVKIYCKI
jgi:hypothetical protein